MAAAHVADASRRPHDTARPYATGAPLILRGVEVVREGRVEPFLHAHPTLSSAAVRWAGLAVEDYSLPACVIPGHKHVESFLHVVLRGSVKYEVLTRGKTLQFDANPGTTFILPRGTIDELRWAGPTHRIAVAIHPSLLVNAMDETAHESDVELTEHWKLTDPHIMAVLLAMKTDLEEGSPAGRLYGESLANALAVYLLNRYTVRRYAPVAYRGGLPGYRLRRVLDHIGDNLADDLSLSQLAAVAGHEPTLLRRTVQQEHGSFSAPVCAVAENRARQTESLRARAQRHRSRTGRRFSESEPFRPYVSQIRGHQSVKIPIGDAVGTTIEWNDISSSTDHAGLHPFSGFAAARSCLTKIFLRGTATLATRVI